MKYFDEYINKNQKILDKALEIDNNKWNEKTIYNDIYQEKIFEFELEEEKTYLIIYDGDPQVTKSICNKAILSKSNFY